MPSKRQLLKKQRHLSYKTRLERDDLQVENGRLQMLLAQNELERQNLQKNLEREAERAWKAERDRMTVREAMAELLAEKPDKLNSFLVHKNPFIRDAATMARRMIKDTQTA